ncbi:anti-sigma factor domain-containing protein [Lacibacterium aquatile]|uniref:Anti-sigma factor domain-containing protein n=1 Tax=Lacibacterium aquatile TaxID=1168082 RepID=A0ABW5DSS2_9PROT
MDQLDRDSLDILAAEHVLGLLGTSTRGEIEAMAANNPDLAEAIQAWESRLAPLAELAPEVAPQAGLWARIAGATFEQAAKAKAVEEDIPAEIIDGRVLKALKRKASRWKTLFFTGFVLTGAAAAAVVALFLTTPAWVSFHPPAEIVARLQDRLGVKIPDTMLAQIQPAARSNVVVLVDESRNPMFVMKPMGDKMAVMPVASVAPPADNKVMHVWVWTDPKTIVWLGTVGPEGTMVPMPAGVKPGNRFCISVEPSAEQPGPAPTGQQMYVGRMVDGTKI